MKRFLSWISIALITLSCCTDYADAINLDHLFQNISGDFVSGNGEKLLSLGNIYSIKTVIPGKVFGAATSNGLVLWDYNTGKPITWIERLKEITSFDVDIDQGLLITGCSDGTIHFIDLAEGKIINTAENPSSFNLSLDYSSKRNQLITVDGNNSNRIWNTKTTPPSVIVSSGIALKKAFFSKDGELIYVIRKSGSEILRADSYETVATFMFANYLLDYPLASKKFAHPFFRSEDNLIFGGLSSLLPNAYVKDCLYLSLGSNYSFTKYLEDLRLSADAAYLLHTTGDFLSNYNTNGTLTIFDIKNIVDIGTTDPCQVAPIQPYTSFEGRQADFIDSTQMVILNETNFLRYNLNEKKTGENFSSCNSGKMNDFDWIGENRFIQANAVITNPKFTILDSKSNTRQIYPSDISISKLQMINDHEMLAYDKWRLYKVNIDTQACDLIFDASPARMHSFDVNQKRNSVLWLISGGFLTEKNLSNKEYKSMVRVNSQNLKEAYLSKSSDNFYCIYVDHIDAVNANGYVENSLIFQDYGEITAFDSFTNSNKVAAGFSTGSFLIADFDSGQTEFVRSVDSSLSCISISNDDKYISIGTVNGCASIWNGVTIDKIRELSKANRRIVGIKYIDNNQQLAVGSLDGMIRTFNLALLDTILPTPTAEPTPEIVATPTPVPQVDVTPTPVSTPVGSTRYSYQFTLFSRFSFDDLSAVSHVPGGFDKHESGTLEIVDIPGSGKGLKITVAPGQVSLIFLPMLLLGRDGPALLKAKIKSTGTEAAIVLGAMEAYGNGSVITNLSKRCSDFNDSYKYFDTFYDPYNDALRPFFQVSNLDGKETNEVIIDELEVYKPE